MTDAVERDPFDVRRAAHAPGLLRPFNDALVLAAADVHVARRLAALSGEGDEAVVLAAAFAVRAPRLGSVHVDLATVRTTAAVDAEEPIDLTTLPWPDPTAWVTAVQRSALVAQGEEGDEDRPLRLLGTRLHLDRYWREEKGLAEDLTTLQKGTPTIDEPTLEDGLRRLFGPSRPGTRREPRTHPSGPAKPEAKPRPAGSSSAFPAEPQTVAHQPSLFETIEPEPEAPGAQEPDRQREAAERAVRHRFAVVAGGPGTGKTTTVARIVALLLEQATAQSAPAPLIALAAPTGRAAARLEESVHAEAAKLDTADEHRHRLQGLHARTLHRLLGMRPGRRTGQYGHANRLPHDVVVVDETSMVSLELMARLAEAVRPDARLVLVGDPGQLRSVDAGAVLGDIVGDTPQPHVTTLTRVRRFGRGIGRVADAIRADDADGAVAALRAAPDEVTWHDVDAADPDAQAQLRDVRDRAVTTFTAAHEAAARGDARAALQALHALRLLCAHRRGPHGVAQWTATVESWLGDLAGDRRFAVGRPLLVTENDPALQLNNGDLGVVVADPAGADGRVLAAFERREAPLTVTPSRLGAVEPAYVMTVHKAQGGQVGTAVVLLPPPASRLLTRELLYTAITRAERHLVLVGTEDALRTAISRPAARASGLRERLS